MRLSDATGVYIGSTPVSKLYVGMQEVWGGSNLTIVGLMGQSEIEHIINPGAFWDMLPVPDVTGTNMIVVRQDGDGNPPIENEVTSANIAAGLVSEAMGALACYLRDMFGSARQFVIADLAVPGTSRPSLVNDSDTSRLWTDFTSVISYVESNFGEFDALIECWYNADDGRISTFKDAFWPVYFGVNPNGSTFTLGTTYTPTSTPAYNIDHCLWDADAAPGQKGRGIFSDNTKWRILTSMPFNNAPVSPSPEWESFTEDPLSRAIEPRRAVMISLADEPEAQRVGLIVGPSAHITDFEGGIHPAENDNPNGKGLFAMSFAAPIATAGNKTISEPFISAIEGPTDGTYIDVVVDLPNNGTLTTLRQLRGLSMPGTPSPHQQVVTGFELFRSASSTRRPVFNESETTYPQAHRGAITITDSGSGSPKKGRVRIDMTDDAVFGDAVSYLRGQATAMLQTPRDVDNELFLDMLIEHIPGYYNSGNDYTYEGVAVKPLQSDIAVNIPAPPFTARGAYYDGEDALTSTTVSTSSGQGMCSLWFKVDGTYEQLLQLFQFRLSGNTRFGLRTTGNGLNIDITLADGSNSNTSFRAGNNNTNMVSGQWYHVLIAWDATSIICYVNDTLSVTIPTGQLAYTGSLNQHGIGSQSSTAGRLHGDMGHVWVSTSQWMDITVQANREKFNIAGVPQDLGPNGQIPTGSTPEYYCDGAGAGWNNVGTLGSFTSRDALTASSTTPGY